ncbi:hypothetical protein KQX54_006162 [Cotesia glomerata]|uniref:Uncharacterized protein n=1 Tax=Cotesia glomerata TaxID=32391 RepID=A0AAV7ILW2_COTGL|nr:hypothetical protein KQX54_006162 [Cotesia glomerata]
MGRWVRLPKLSGAGYSSHLQQFDLFHEVFWFALNTVESIYQAFNSLELAALENPLTLSHFAQRFQPDPDGNA